MFYDRDAALDQLAEWEEEQAMEAYYAQEYDTYQDTINMDEFHHSPYSSGLQALQSRPSEYDTETPASLAFRLASEINHLPSVPIQAWTETKTPVENKINISPKKYQLSMNSETKTILQKIEKEGEQKIAQLAQKNDLPDTDTLIHIMKQGAEEFRQQTGRNMTYSEMRNAYG